MKREHMIQAGKFKAECLKIMDRVNKTKQDYIITKRKIPIVRLSPISSEMPHLFGKMKGTVHIRGDIIAPIGEEWNAAS